MTSGGPVRPERHALLELDALLERVEQLAVTEDRARYDGDDVYRWALHRLWIAIGSEAYAYCRLVGLDVNRDRPWARLYQLRCWLAHDRLPDVDEDFVWRMSNLGVVSVRARVRAVMR